MTGSAPPRLLRPHAPKPGDLVVASLSGPLHAAYEHGLAQAVAVCSSGRDSACVGHRSSARAAPWAGRGSAADAAEGLKGLLRDPQPCVITAHDGGRTALGRLDPIGVAAVAAGPEPILGHSDISLPHLLLCARTGQVGFHTDPAVPGLGGARPTAPAARRAELERFCSALPTGDEAIGALPAAASWECRCPGPRRPVDRRPAQSHRAGAGDACGA
ncbi:LD-carboxypeptidase [Streptomyces pimonensis]|uniref:LD-carboxypeptidase n=1 Tax=Streptomyces pimonensis TaxID=2860288 RepID=UPI0035298A66